MCRQCLPTHSGQGTCEAKYGRRNAIFCSFIWGSGPALRGNRLNDALYAAKNKTFFFFFFGFLRLFDSALASPEYPIRGFGGPCARVSTHAALEGIDSRISSA